MYLYVYSAVALLPPQANCVWGPSHRSPVHCAQQLCFHWGKLFIIYTVTSQMTYHRGGEPEQAMHCSFNVMAHKPWITAEFVTVCCSMSLVSNTSCTHFFGQWSYILRLHICFKLHTEVMRWICRAYGCRLCMDLPEANSTTVCDLYCLWAACPCLSWSAVAMRVLTWVVFIPRASHRCCALAVALYRRDSRLGISHAQNYPRTFGLHEIFKCAHLKYIHTYTQLPHMQSR